MDVGAASVLVFSVEPVVFGFGGALVEHLRGFGDAMVGEPVGWRGILHCSL
jgi:hypothetical protein